MRHWLTSRHGLAAILGALLLVPSVRAMGAQHPAANPSVPIRAHVDITLGGLKPEFNADAVDSAFRRTVARSYHLIPPAEESRAPMLVYEIGILAIFDGSNAVVGHTVHTECRLVERVRRDRDPKTVMVASTWRWRGALTTLNPTHDLTAFLIEASAQCVKALTQEHPI